MLGKDYYNTILATAFSSCGEYFVAGNVFGDIRLFKIKNLLNNVEGDLSENHVKISKNRFDFNCGFPRQISCMVSTEKFFIAGINGEIVGWLWSDVIGLENGNALQNFAWKIRLPQTSGSAEIKNELNCIKNETSVDEILYAGSSDNNIYAFSLEDGRCLRTFVGHTDYVHSLDIRENMLVSAGEDGTVRIWDSRAKEIVNMLKPCDYSSVSRPNLGHWIGDVSLNEDWMVCGGGARLSLWNLRNMDSPMTVFSNTQDQGIHISQFYQDRILAGGSSPYFSVLSYNDELYSGIETSSGTLYSCSINVNNEMDKMACVTGSSNKIDISTNFHYREYVVPFY